jgi:hypothetical protein
MRPLRAAESSVTYALIHRYAIGTGEAMYRCDLVRNGRVELRENLETVALDQAIAAGHKLLNSRHPTENFDGIEIWDGGKLVYEFGAPAFG